MADSVYDWQGTCTLGCEGLATGVLTLGDGASPFNFDVSSFVSFQFTSSSGMFLLDNSSPYINAIGIVGVAGAGCNIPNCASVAHLDQTRCRSGNLFLPRRLFPSLYHPNQEAGSSCQGLTFGSVSIPNVEHGLITSFAMSV